jgi:hypothetical protein
VVIRISFRPVASSRQNNQLPTPNDGNVHKTGHRTLFVGYGNVAVDVPRISYDADDATIYATKLDNVMAVGTW